VRVRRLTEDDGPQVAGLVALDPCAAAAFAARVEVPGIRRAGGPAWGAFDGSQLRSALLWVGNALPIGPDPEACGALARTSAIRRLVSTAVTGPRLAVTALWSHLAGVWGPPAGLRLEQDVYVCRAPSRVAPDPHARLAGPKDVDALFGPSVAMFTEELGVSPLEATSAASYRRRLSALAGQGRILLSTDSCGVRFKAELALVTADTCQIQGVWVRPDVRGRGVGSSGMAATLIAGLRLAPSVSLSVNRGNRAAVATYRAVGMEVRSAAATVLLPRIRGVAGTAHPQAGVGPMGRLPFESGPSGPAPR
jgi:GNAT superfamily N-acetyltransferase